MYFKFNLSIEKTWAHPDQGVLDFHMTSIQRFNKDKKERKERERGRERERERERERTNVSEKRIN